MLSFWIDGLRLSLLIYGICILSGASLFLWRGSMPRELKRCLRGAAWLWPLAYFSTMQSIPNLGWPDWVFGLILPSLFSFVLPEFIQASMECYYHVFGWPRRIRHVHRERQKNQLAHTLLRPRQPS